MNTITPAQVRALHQRVVVDARREERARVRIPTTPEETLAHLALEARANSDQVRTVIREFCHLAGLDRGPRDLRGNAESACHFLMDMTEVEL